ncbi:MAG: host attachment protein [Pseudomonadota bacterium]|nr:host attachment protein [Pseudomonadota bacterium]
MNTSTWVLIADSSNARLYSVADRGKPWTLIDEYKHPPSRVTEGGLVSDQAGRTHGSGIAKGARSAMESKTAPKDVEIKSFAHELVTVLEHGHGQQAYSRLVMAAPPHFLGLLRKGISSTVGKLVSATTDKDYLHIGEKEMQAHLDPLVQPLTGVHRAEA